MEESGSRDHNTLVSDWPGLLGRLEAAGPVHGVRQVHREAEDEARTLPHRPQPRQDDRHGGHRGRVPAAVRGRVRGGGAGRGRGCVPDSLPAGLLLPAHPDHGGQHRQQSRHGGDLRTRPGRAALQVTGALSYCLLFIVKLWQRLLYSMENVTK